MDDLIRHKQDLEMLGYFEDTATADFVCGILGCESKIRETSNGGFVLITSATNTCSISVAPSFSSLVDKIIGLHDANESFEYFETLEDGTMRVCSATAIFAKKDKRNSRQVTDTMQRVKSSNVWAYAYDIEMGENIGTLYVQFKNRNGGPGDIYEYIAVPIKAWRKFVTAPSKGHYFWKAIRNKFRYRKLTGDKKGKLANAINSTL